MKKASISLLILSWLFTCGCGKPASGGAPALSPTPIISYVSPLSGDHETTVVIKGAYFGTDARRICVCFNRKNAPIFNLTDSLLTTTVPAGAGSGVIEIKVGGKVIMGPRFVYTAAWQSDDEFRSNPRPTAAKAVLLLAHSIGIFSKQVPTYFPKL